MAIRIDGYSERGMVNAICEDICRAGDLHQLTKFLSWISFPFQPKNIPDFSGITSARFLVEQGFSDFGDLDLLILLDHADRKQAILIEAKVAAETGKRIDDQWTNFLAFLQGVSKHRSSLFVQLYRKLRLIERTADLNKPFETHPFWKKQSLGEKRVVLKAAQLLAEYRENPWYVALTPDNSNAVYDFFATTLREYTPNPQQLPNWDVSRMGYLTWPDLHKHFLDESDKSIWQRSLSTFDWNEHQIYQKHIPVPGKIIEGSLARLISTGQQVVIVVKGTLNHRVIEFTGLKETSNFPKSFPVKADELTPMAEPIIDISIYQPKRGSIYFWNPQTQPIQPSDRALVPEPPKIVKVKDAGWENTRVILVNAEGVEQGIEFHVFPDHLERQPYPTKARGNAVSNS